MQCDLSPVARAHQAFRASRGNIRSRCPQGDAVIELRAYQEDCVRRIREGLTRPRQVNRKGRVMLASHTVNPAPVFWQERRRV